MVAYHAILQSMTLTQVKWNGGGTWVVRLARAIWTRALRSRFCADVRDWRFELGKGTTTAILRNFVRNFNVSLVEERPQVRGAQNAERVEGK